MNENNTPAAVATPGRMARMKAGLAALSLAMVSPFAFAAGESTEVLATMAEYKTEAVLIIVGFAVILWTLRGTNLLKPR